MVDPVTLTPEKFANVGDPAPEAWGQSFTDAFNALALINLPATDRMFQDMQQAKADGGSLHWQIGQLIAREATDPAGARAGLIALAPKVYAWINRVNWVRTRGEASIGQDFGDFFGHVQSSAQAAAAAAAAASGAASAFVNFPWGWAALALAAVFVLPAVLGRGGD